MNILAIESSCDETAVAVTRGRTVLSSVIASQVEEQKLFGGVVPEIASRRHTENIVACTEQALSDAGLTADDIDAVAVTYAPGLIGAVLVGVNFAKSFAFARGLPLVPVHHLRSHIAANYLTHPDLKPPFLALVVSGGHSHIVEVTDYTRMKVIGRTRDDAAGECFDKCARAMGLPYPGGIHLDKIAEQGNPDAFALPHPKVTGSELDFSFSGLKTAVVNLLHNAEQKGETVSTPDLCASVRKTAVEMLTQKFLAAAEHTGHKTLVLAGGVSANSLLRREMQRLAEQQGYALYFPELRYCGDNAAMVGAQGIYEYEAGNLADTSLNAYATMPIDAVEF